MSILVSESSEPVTKRDQLVDYFARGEKSNEHWRIGVQHEKFPYRLLDLSWPGYEEPQGLREFMQGMRRFGWEPAMEGGNIIGLTRGKAAITFEPGGQIELAGAPLQTLHETDAELRQHLQEACTVGALRLVCNDPRIPWVQLALPANAVSALWQGYGIVLAVLNPSAWAIDADVAYIQAVRNVMREAIVTEHRNAVIDCVTVPSGLAFQQDGRSIGAGLNGCTGHWHVGDAFYEQIALGI